MLLGTLSHKLSSKVKHHNVNTIDNECVCVCVGGWVDIFSFVSIMKVTIFFL